MRGALVVLVVGLWSCRSATQVTFEVTTDIACSEHRGTILSVGRLSEIDSRPVSSSRAECDPKTGRIGSVVVVPSEGNEDEIAARFVLGIGKSPERCVDDGFKGGCIVARRALRFIAHEPLVVAVPMRNECRDVVCPSGKTCVRGNCVGAQILNVGGCVGAGCGEEAVATPIDGGVDANIDASSDAPIVGKRVFVTGTTFTANLGGVVGADAKCQTAADVAGLVGSFRAWLSDTSSSPSTRFSRGGPYVLLDGSVVANDWSELTSGKLKRAINLTEGKRAPTTGTGYCSGQTVAAWTGTEVNGARDTLHESCSGFTTGSFSFVAQIQFGDPSAADAKWTAGPCLSAGASNCAKQAALYCFEQ